MSASSFTDTSSEILSKSMVFDEIGLQQYDLIFYPINNTLSNSTVCYYIAPPTSGSSLPTLSPNGTISPSLSKCSDPVRPIRVHGIVGMIVGVGFAITLVLGIASLQRVSRGSRRRNRPDGLKRGERRQYFLALGTAVIGLVASFNAVDVDRVVVSGLGFKVQSIFYGLLHPLLLMSEFEAVRYLIWRWTKDFEEAEDRSKFGSRVIGVLTPLFYALDITALALIVARNWDDLTRQWYDEQIEMVARPAATDERFQTGYLMMVVCYLIIVLRLSLGWRQFRKLAKITPMPEFRRRLWHLSHATFLTVLPIGYNVTSLYVWNVSSYNTQAKQAWYYGYGMIPVVLALCILNMSGITRSSGDSNMSGGVVLPPTTRPRRPSWWHDPNSIAFDNSANTLGLNAWRDIRGREEKYSTAKGRWWWQMKEEKVVQLVAQDEVQPEVLQLDILPTAQNQTETLSLVNESGTTATKESSFASSSRSAQKFQHRQGSSIRSMLDV